MKEYARGVSRRMIVKGAAWSIPVIAGAAAVPAQSASGCNQIGTTLLWQATAANLDTPHDEYQLRVPDGVRRMHFIVVGGDGGYAYQTGDGDATGKGAYIEGDMAVSPGDEFYLQPGAGGEDSGGGGRGGKSLYGSGGDGGVNADYLGAGGGGASALLSVTRAPLIVAGGGGGSNINSVPVGPDEARYSSSVFHDQTATYGSTTVSLPGGYLNAGLPGAPGDTGDTGWMGLRASASVDPKPSEVVLMAGGGRGAGAAANAPGAGGKFAWVTGPGFSVNWYQVGSPGSGTRGGNGGSNGVSPNLVSAAGGGGGGYSGGGGGATVAAEWNTPPAPYGGQYGITGGGGGGSSYVESSNNLIVQLDPRSITSGNGLMGYVQVSFFGC
ncbi:hypothetical protein ACUOFU_05215 [Microbacterium arabinogalactanolyticum]|uniref:hypothetical protein n=1 Tax=Microbacterium arabinogalactanolyticum TaxID=69365 RepID=UPI004044A61B